MRTASHCVDVDDLVVELHPPAPAHDDEDLFLRLMGVADREPIAGRDALEGQAGPLELERPARVPELQVRWPVEVRPDIRDVLPEVLERERHAPRSYGRSSARGVLTGHLWPAAHGVAWITWIPPRTSPSSSPAAARRSRRSRSAFPRTALAAWKGLQREEVAWLADVSVEYYRRLERGNASGVSDGVLEALASALRLDDAERAHLHDLARAANPVAPPAPPVDPATRSAGCPADRRRHDPPAIVRNSRVDYLSANALGRALYAPVFESREQPANSARFTFLDPGRAGLLRRLGAHRQGPRGASGAPRPVATPTTASSRT